MSWLDDYARNGEHPDEPSAWIDDGQHYPVTVEFWSLEGVLHHLGLDPIEQDHWLRVEGP